MDTLDDQRYLRRRQGMARARHKKPVSLTRDLLQSRLWNRLRIRRWWHQQYWRWLVWQQHLQWLRLWRRYVIESIDDFCDIFPSRIPSLGCFIAQDSNTIPVACCMLLFFATVKSPPTSTTVVQCGGQQLPLWIGDANFLPGSWHLIFSFLS